MRIYQDEQGERYRVRLAPRELSGARGVSRRLKAVVFETVEGGWVGAAPVYAHVTLPELTDTDLCRLLEIAMRRSL